MKRLHITHPILCVNVFQLLNVFGVRKFIYPFQKLCSSIHLNSLKIVAIDCYNSSRVITEIFVFCLNDQVKNNDIIMIMRVMILQIIMSPSTIFPGDRQYRHNERSLHEGRLCLSFNT